MKRIGIILLLGIAITLISLGMKSENITISKEIKTKPAVKEEIQNKSKETKETKEKTDTAIVDFFQAEERQKGRLFPTGERSLYYDGTTFVVYYVLQQGGSGNMSPFYSGEGNLVKFDVETKEFKEIVKKETQEPEEPFSAE